jgi:hypothetical protein
MQGGKMKDGGFLAESYSKIHNRFSSHKPDMKG